MMIYRHTQVFRALPFTSEAYFTFLFSLCTAERLNEKMGANWTLTSADCTSYLLAGLATSADTGNEDLVIASRAALAAHCDLISHNDEVVGQQQQQLDRIASALTDNLKRYLGQDRIVVPTLEVVAFLFSTTGLLLGGGAAGGSSCINLRQLCLLAQKAAFKTGNVRKLEACVKVYGAIAAAPPPASVAPGDEELALASRKREDGVREARRRLGALMLHPWPRVRAMVADELWTISSTTSAADGGGDGTGEQNAYKGEEAQAMLLGVDWGKADKAAVKRLVGGLGLDGDAVPGGSKATSAAAAM